MVTGESAATRAGICPARRIEGIPGLAVVGESISQHHRVARGELVIQLSRCLCFGAGNREKSVRHRSRGQARKLAASEYAIHRVFERRREKGVFLGPVMLLLESPVEKGSVFDDRTSQSHPGAITPEAGPRAFRFEGIARIEGPILQENEDIAMHRIGAGSRDYIDGAARGAARFGG
jgi:hypothetical protein